MALSERLIPTPETGPDRWPWHAAKWRTVRAGRMWSGDRRMEAETYLLSGYGIRAAIEARPGLWRPFGELADAWMPPRIKSILVSREHGVPYLNTSQVFDVRPAPWKWLAAGKTKNAAERTAEEGTILVMASSSIGRTTLTTRAHADCYLSHHFIRVEPRQPALKGWLYGFLHSPAGQAMMAGSQYASAVRHIESHHLAALPVPTVSGAVAADFDGRLNAVLSLRNEAFRLANEADNLFASVIGPVEPPARTVEFLYSIRSIGIWQATVGSRVSRCQGGCD